MKKLNLKYLLFSFGLTVLLFSYKVPEFVPSDNMKAHQVTTNSGPEDIVLDNSNVIKIVKRQNDYSIISNT